MTRSQNPAVRDFILDNVGDHPTDIVSVAVAKFGMGRASINRYIRRLIEDGLVDAIGKTKARRYSLKNLVDEKFLIENITRSMSEDTVWRYRVLPFLGAVPQNVIDICQYGFTEIFNNVIDHSVSDSALISIEMTVATTEITVADFGVGVFRKIQNDFNLPDARSALLELSKGKLTSDKENHAGEGIFLTSRMFDSFNIMSFDLYFDRTRTNDANWLIETGDADEGHLGTVVRMTISNNANWSTKEVFSQYIGDSIGFRKTHVPIKLGRHPGEQLVSRSQAKRVLARFDEFSEVILDFEGIDTIGQAFADEIFRVFENSHPNIDLLTLNANEAVQKMISHVTYQHPET